MARVVWAPKALDDLEELLAYIARDAPVTARRFAQKVVSRAEFIGDHPLVGGYVAEDDSRTYRQVLHGAYRIIYRTDGETVYVVAIHHAARLLDAESLE